MEKYFEINENNNNIRCKLYFNKGDALRKVVLYGHGFAGHKDAGAGKKFAERVLAKYKGIGVMAFDLPCHGNDVKKKLVLGDCLDYMDLAVGYIKNTLQAEEIYSYATSFGGYLVLKYLAERGNPFRKIVLRSPALNLYESMTGVIMTEADRELLAKGKDALVGFDRKIRINPQFLQDIQACDVRKMDFLDFAEDLLILHGTRDEVVDFAESEGFAEENIIEFIPVEGADHRFQNPNHMETAIKAVIQFFEF